MSIIINDHKTCENNANQCPQLEVGGVEILRTFMDTHLKFVILWTSLLLNWTVKSAIPFNIHVVFKITF